MYCTTKHGQVVNHINNIHTYLQADMYLYTYVYIIAKHQLRLLLYRSPLPQLVMHPIRMWTWTARLQKFTY